MVIKGCSYCNHNHVIGYGYQYCCCRTCVCYSNFDSDGYKFSYVRSDSQLKDNHELTKPRTFNISSEHVEVVKQELSKKEVLEKRLNDLSEMIESVRLPEGFSGVNPYIEYFESEINSLKNKILDYSQPSLYGDDFYIDDEEEIKRSEIQKVDPSRIVATSIILKDMGFWGSALARLKGFYR